MTKPAARWVIDLDGVVWRGTDPIEGSVEALCRLFEAGHSVLYFTNHAESPEIKIRRLRGMGVPEPLVITSAEAAAHLCGVNRRALVLGEPSLAQVIRDSGIDAIFIDDLPPDGPVPSVDAVIVGAATNWDRSRTGLAADAIRDGAMFIGTNSDPLFPFTGEFGPRFLPGAGALISAVETTAGARATFAGKPYQPAADLVTSRFGHVDYVVGDRDDTDGGFARRLGATFALVMSGGTSREQIPSDPAPEMVHDDLAAVVDHVLGLAGSRR